MTATVLRRSTRPFGFDPPEVTRDDAQAAGWTVHHDDTSGLWVTSLGGRVYSDTTTEDEAWLGATEGHAEQLPVWCSDCGDTGACPECRGDS